MGSSQRIRLARTQILGFSQLELAMAMKVAPMTVSRWERGVSSPSPANLRQLAEYVEKPVSWFFDEEPVAA